MNLPNKLTMLRIILIPVFMVVLYWGFPGANYVALAIFIAASFTDMLDGKIARKFNLVTGFGKFACPLADKMLERAGRGRCLFFTCFRPQRAAPLQWAQGACSSPADARTSVTTVRLWFMDVSLLYAE